MDILQVSKTISIDCLLDRIEAIIEQQIRFVILEFENEISDVKCKEIVKEIKNHFDIFIILKTNIPMSKNRVEEYLYYGIHGILYHENSGEYSEKQIEMMIYTVDVFPGSLVFATVRENKDYIDEFLNARIAPVVPNRDEDLVSFIKNHSKFHTVSSRITKYVPILETNQYNFKAIDKIRIKMLLETINFSQKLMVKNIEDSFNSSSL